MSEEVSTDISLDLSGMKLLKETLEKLAKTSVEVGVFSEHDARSDGGSNAQIGAVHDLGFPEKNIPQRSWLTIPLEQNLQKAVEDTSLEGKTAPQVAAMVAGKALGVVHTAFDSSGPGWPPPKYREGKPLLDTTELRGSISTRIKEDL